MTPTRFKRTTSSVALALYFFVPVVDVSAGDDSGWGGNLVLNPSFEGGKASWEIRRAAELTNRAEQAGMYVNATIMLDDRVAHSGHTSLSISSDSSTTFWHCLESDPIGVQAGKQYRLSSWIKTEEVRQEGEQYYNSNVYVRFVDTADEEVRIGKLRLRATERLLGTNDWTHVERVVTAPEGAELAYVGCVMTCSGKAWFDDIELHQHAGFPWKTRETDRFVLYFEDSDAPSESAIADLESHLGKIEQQLRVKHAGKIRYYKYASTELKKTLTGNTSNAHYEGESVHADSWEDRHEIVHVITAELGESVAFLEEGLAVHLAGSWGGHDLHSYAKLLANDDKLLPIGQLLDDKAFRTFPPDGTYPQAGSFVRYLIELFGMDRFKKLYPIEDPRTAMSTISARFKDLYALSINEAEEAWHKFLVPPGTRPGEIQPGLFQVDPGKSDTP